MELWLFRHGKAESGGLQVSDEDRALIERGREDVAFMANQLQKDWEGKSVEFWSSPLKRARETTEILMSSLGGVPHIHLAIATGDLETLLTLWAYSQADIQIMVGHEPLLSLWLESFTGTKKDFETAGVAKIAVYSWIPPEGKFKGYQSPHN